MFARALRGEYLPGPPAAPASGRSGPCGLPGGAPGFSTCRESRPEAMHELALVDDPILKCKHSEEQMAVGAGGHGEPPGHDVIISTTDHGHGAPVAGKRRDGSIIACTCGPCIPRVGPC